MLPDRLHLGLMLIHHCFRKKLFHSAKLIYLGVVKQEKDISLKCLQTKIKGDLTAKGINCRYSKAKKIFVSLKFEGVKRFLNSVIG